MNKLSKKSPSNEAWVMLTAYDALMARQVENGGADLILVGDSLGKAILGYEGVEEVTLDDMAHHCKAVCRGRKNIPVIGDLPQGTYENVQQAIKSSQKLMNQGVDYVKLEGFIPDIIKTLCDNKTPVIAHLGHTPQKADPNGKVVSANRLESAKILLQNCIEIEKAGASAIVLEMVSREVVKTITDVLKIPTIGIGSGPDSDGQVLVITDMWGESEYEFKFLRKFGEIEQNKCEAVKSYCSAVRKGDYPADENSFHIKKDEKTLWEEISQS
jgi:3-methyl-2-oxobutanoate hydroxymethyltransferase